MPEPTATMPTIISPVMTPRRLITKDRAPSFFAGLKTRDYRENRHAALAIRAIAWNNSGSRIACALQDRIVRVWNPDKPETKYSTELRGHTGVVEKVAWDPTHPDRLASGGQDGFVKFWDVRSAKCLHTVHTGGEIITLSYRPNGENIIVGSRADVLSVIDVRTQKVIKQHKEETQTNDIIWSHSGDMLIETTGNGHVRFRSWPSWEVVYTLNAHPSSCFSLDLDPRGRMLAVGGGDALISLWDTKDWICVNALTKVEGPVRSVGFSFDGMFVCGSSDETNDIEIAHAESGEYVHRISTNTPVPSLAWHPNRYWLAYSGDPVGLRIVGAAGGGA